MDEKYEGMRIDSDGKKAALLIYVSNGCAGEMDFEEGMPAMAVVEKLRILASRLEWLLTGQERGYGRAHD